MFPGNKRSDLRFVEKASYFRSFPRFAISFQRLSPSETPIFRFSNLPAPRFPESCAVFSLEFFPRTVLGIGSQRVFLIPNIYAAQAQRAVI